jgi:hypothetical protein
VFDPDDLAGPTFKPEQLGATAAQDGSFDAAFAASTSNAIQARPVGNYTIKAFDPTGTVVGQLTFPMPCNQFNPRITAVKPNCGPDANSQPPPPANYSIEVIGRGFIPGAATVSFDTAGTVETFATHVDDSGRLDAQINPTVRVTGVYDGSVQQSDALRSFDPVPFTFTVPCPTTTTPTLTVTPGTATPGFVVEVHGEGFQAGATVDLFWSQGIDAARPIEVTADADGMFDQQVLIFAHDFEGDRQMTAGTPTNPNAFPTATASLLVAAGAGLPPAFNVFGGSPSDQPPIILRR